MEKSPQLFDVCIVCALPEEARAFLEVIQQHCGCAVEEGIILFQGEDDMLQGRA
jgi:hypothetical protein